MASGRPEGERYADIAKNARILGSMMEIPSIHPKVGIQCKVRESTTRPKSEPWLDQEHMGVYVAY